MVVAILFRVGEELLAAFLGALLSHGSYPVFIPKKSQIVPQTIRLLLEMLEIRYLNDERGRLCAGICGEAKRSGRVTAG